MNYKSKYEFWNKQETLPKYLKEQLSEYKEEQKEDCFYKDLSFGTGGIRGVVGAGTNRMNIYTIRKATQGFAEYLLDSNPNIKEKGIVIAHDCRHFSKEFAEETAAVMATNGIKAYLFDELQPTPLLSYSVRHLNAGAGVVITASHNPPKYNGYKIYDETGCQLVPEFANKVVANVDAIQDVFAIKVDDFKVLTDKGLINQVNDDVIDAYVSKVLELSLSDELDYAIKAVFTPLHGTSAKLSPRVLKEAGYTNIYTVDEQLVPDPNFSTVALPNPEEAKAFEMAIALGKEKDADILMATDPDADRIGLAVKNNKDEYELLTGNQTGALLIDYILERKKQQGTLPANGWVFNTVVTSDMGAVIAKASGLNVKSTLTGFKFIGEQIFLQEGTDQNYVFGYEESYGYLIGDFARDKDAIQATLLCTEMAAYYKKHGKTLLDRLNELYDTFGYFKETLLSYGLEGKAGEERITQIMTDLREQSLPKIAGISVVAKEDYLLQVKSSGERTTKIDLPKSNVLKFVLEDGSWLAARPSGTEPKIKFYVGVKCENLNQANDKIEQISNFVKSIMN